LNLAVMRADIQAAQGDTSLCDAAAGPTGQVEAILSTISETCVGPSAEATTTCRVGHVSPRASHRLNLHQWKLKALRDAGTLAMADHKQKQKPGPESGYREQHDPRGQPGQDQTRDGKQLPEEADKAKPKPREPEKKGRRGG
jgi:hypothetical protein